MLPLSKYCVKAEFPKPEPPVFGVPDMNFILFAHVNDNSVVLLHAVVSTLKLPEGDNRKSPHFTS